MDLTTAVTAATGSIPAISAKTPDADAETPAPRIHPLKTVSSTNGVLKRHHPYSPHHRHVSTVPPPPAITYRDCLKNHAASLGGYAVDGCGEFMPSPSATPSDPTSLKCAACGCHRNFHRRDPEEVPPPPVTSALQVLEFQPHHRHHPPPPPAAPRSPDSQSPPPISSSYYPSAPHMLLALSAGLSGHPENPNPVIHATPTAAMHLSPNGRKRFRTKFTPGQKEKMHHFAERVGWKMQKKDEDLVSQFCSEVGVERNVLKVWMHNNKNTLGRRDFNPNSGGDHLVDGGDDDDDDEDRHHRCPSHSDPNHHHHHHLSGDLGTAPFGTNASSSSS